MLKKKIPDSKPPIAAPICPVAKFIIVHRNKNIENAKHRTNILFSFMIVPPNSDLSFCVETKNLCKSCVPSSAQIPGALAAQGVWAVSTFKESLNKDTI